MKVWEEEVKIEGRVSVKQGDKSWANIFYHSHPSCVNNFK